MSATRTIPPPELRIRRVLYPTDFSEETRGALDLALLWCRHFGAELEALHVVPLPEQNPVYPSRYASDSAEVWPELEARVLAELETSVPSDGSLGIRVRHVIGRNRYPATAIARHAVQRDVDLVVMGTHGRRGFRAFLIGSVTEIAMREVTCPILAVHHRDDEGAPALPTRILAPIDFSPFALQTARHARGAAAAFGATITYLHIVESGRVPEFYASDVALPSRAESKIRHRAQDAIEALDREAGGSGADSEVHVVPGDPAEDIVRFADAHAIDLIVIPTHGLNAIDRLLVGSVADKVVRRATCPVLILQPYGKQIVEPRPEERATSS